MATVYASTVLEMASVINGNTSAATVPDITDPVTLFNQLTTANAADFRKALADTEKAWQGAVVGSANPTEWGAQIVDFIDEVNLALPANTTMELTNIQANWKPVINQTTGQIIGHISTAAVRVKNQPAIRYEENFSVNGQNVKITFHAMIILQFA